MQVERQASLRQRRQVKLLGEIVVEHDGGIADAHFDVHEFASGPGPAGYLDGAESVLQEVGESRGAFDRQVRRDGMETGRNWISWFWHLRIISQAGGSGTDHRLSWSVAARLTAMAFIRRESNPPSTGLGGAKEQWRWSRAGWVTGSKKHFRSRPGFSVGQDGILRGDCQSPRGPIANRPAGCLPANLPTSPQVFHEIPRAEGPSQQTTKTDRLSHLRSQLPSSSSTSFCAP